MEDRNIPEILTKPYDPAEHEARLYEAWEKAGYFNPDACVELGVAKPDAEPFSMVLPPPNVTGTLHTGHALMLVIEDIMARYARMQGKRTLWLPGTDHAAIATQSKVEKLLEKEGLRKQEMGREAFLARVEAFARESHDTIVGQARRMGASLDWSREAFTLDEQRSFAVRTAFKAMYDDGLIYRGYRIVNWDPKGQTVISDDEIVHEERKAKLYTFRYSKDFPIAISTTRPETKVGDTAVAVHPEDPRYAEYVGKEYDAVFCGVPIHITVIADDAVEKDFGTGALGVTPAHSQIDWEMAQRHKLPTVPVINEYAKMTVEAEALKGKKVGEARETIVEWLRAEGLMEKEEDVTQNVSTAERTGAVIEPLPKLQWFIDVNKPSKLRGGKTLKELMLAPVREGKITIMPEHFERIYFHWVENLRDWCISRQIWYGHRIPVWYRSGETYCGIEAPEGDGWIQDEDSLDTWFSSGLWTFSTLGWPEETLDLKTYHPTTVLETGYDILPFWVARMILMSTYHLGDIPFRTVYFHGLVRDEKGRKMSKSLGNIVDPLTLIDKYGTDALRMSMTIGVAAGNDSNVGEDKVKGYKNFANKLWNIERFILMSVAPDAALPAAGALLPADQERLDAWRETLRSVTAHLDAYRLHLAAEELYHYLWHVFADVIVEESKPILFKGSEAEQESRSALLLSVWSEGIAALHPFMPFVTEALWEHLPIEGKRPLIITTWPSQA